MRRQDMLTKALLAGAYGSGGGAFVVGHLAVASTPPATVALLRYLIAVALFAVLLTRSRDGVPIPGAMDLLRIAGMGLTVVAGYNLVLLEEFRLAPAAEGVLLVGARRRASASSLPGPFFGSGRVGGPWRAARSRAPASSPS